MSGCNHEKCLRDKCKFCCYCSTPIEVSVEVSDTERLEWLMPRVSGKAYRDIGVIYSDGSKYAIRKAIDEAMKASKE
jgi:hypothetical protein